MIKLGKCKVTERKIMYISSSAKSLYTFNYFLNSWNILVLYISITINVFIIKHEYMRDEALKVSFHELLTGSI